MVIRSNEGNENDRDGLATNGLVRRELIKKTLAVGVTGALASAGLGEAEAQIAAGSAADSRWDHEADVVIVGAGASGLACAIRLRDAGLSVLIVDQNFDVGGKMLESGGWVSLGGGDPVQLRDIAGHSDKEGFVTVPPLHTPEELKEDDALLFRDLTDWSVVDLAAQAPYRYNERDLHHAWVKNASATRQFLIDNHIRFGRISGTHPNGGISRARRAVAFLRLGEKTDILAGTVSREDAGIVGVASTHFAPAPMHDGSKYAGPGTVTNGAAISRGLEFSARSKGARFILNHHMDEIVREQQFSGRILGIRTSYSPRHDPDTGAKLASLWKNGNIDDSRKTLSIRARKAVLIASGGHSGNTRFRGMFDPAARDPAFSQSALALLGERGQDASGIIAGMRVGAALAGLQQNASTTLGLHIPARLATRDSYSGMLPGHPTFSFRKSSGIALAPEDYQHLIAVNQVGKRFFSETWISKSYPTPVWPGGRETASPTGSLNHVQYNWKNSAAEWVRQSYTRNAALEAAVAINEGSQEPDFLSGPIWAIFDQAAVDRRGWNISPPFTADNGYFFSDQTLEGLAEKIHHGNEFQRMPLKYLKETVERWNSFVDSGVDDDFCRESDSRLYKIMQPPFYAASAFPVWHDSYGGLRINGKCEVLDFQGEAIGGLYSGGEASGGGTLHGLGRALVHGYIAAGSILERA